MAAILRETLPLHARRASPADRAEGAVREADTGTGMSEDEADAAAAVPLLPVDPARIEGGIRQRIGSGDMRLAFLAVGIGVALAIGVAGYVLLTMP